MQETWDADLILGSGRFTGEGRGNPLQCSCLKNPLDRGVWWYGSHLACRYLVSRGEEVPQSVLSKLENQESWWSNSIQVWRPENQELQWPRVGERGYPRSRKENLPFLWFLFSLGLWRSGWWLCRSLFHPHPLGIREARRMTIFLSYHFSTHHFSIPELHLLLGGAFTLNGK